MLQTAKQLVPSVQREHPRMEKATQQCLRVRIVWWVKFRPVVPPAPRAVLVNLPLEVQRRVPTSATIVVRDNLNWIPQLQLRVKPVAKECTLKLLPPMRLRVLRVAQIVPPEVRHLQRVVLHRRAVLPPLAHRVLLERSIQQVLFQLRRVNAACVLLVHPPLVVLRVVPIRVTFVEPVNFNWVLLLVRVVTASKEPTWRHRVLLLLRVLPSAKYAHLARIKIQSAARPASFVHRGRN